MEELKEKTVVNNNAWSIDESQKTEEQEKNTKKSRLEFVQKPRKTVEEAIADLEQKHSWHFATPFYYCNIIDYIPKIDEACEAPVIESANEPTSVIVSRELKDITKLDNFKDFILKNSENLLKFWGYNIDDYKLVVNSIKCYEARRDKFLVNNHNDIKGTISGFLVLRQDSDYLPRFEDPRAGHYVMDLPPANIEEASGVSAKHFVHKAETGTFFAFPSYLNYSFSCDDLENMICFRYLTYSISCVPNSLINDEGGVS